MSKQLSMTIPDVVYNALTAKGAIFDIPGPEFLKQYVIASAMGADVPLGLKAALDHVINKPTETVEETSLTLEQE